jgi:hypothetical protein
MGWAHKGPDGPQHNLRAMVNLWLPQACSQQPRDNLSPQWSNSCVNCMWILVRMNQTLLTLLNTLSEEVQAHWEEQLPAILQAYNNTVHSRTGYTPHFLMVGRHARLPIQCVLGSQMSQDRWITGCSIMMGSSWRTFSLFPQEITWKVGRSLGPHAFCIKLKNPLIRQTLYFL